MRRKWWIVLAALLIVVAGTGVAAANWHVKADEIRVAVVHKEGSEAYLDAYQHLRQTLIVHAVVEQTAWPLEGKMLSRYDALFLDASLAEPALAGELAEALEPYVSKGGMLFVDNEFGGVLPDALIGAKAYVEMDELPEQISFPEAPVNAAGVQTVVRQFTQDIARSYSPERLGRVALGVGVVPSTAQVLAGDGDVGLYTLNRYGDGYVLFGSKLLPSSAFVTGFDLQQRGDGESWFNYTFATGSYMLRNAFVSFVSMEKLGFAVEKVHGTNGRPAMAWQNHYEVLTAMRDGGMDKWADYLQQYDQIPSLSLVREAYDWGVWKEGLAYYPNIGSTGEPAYEGENVHSGYSSGHVVQQEPGQAVEPLTLATYPDAVGLSEPITEPYRLVPDVSDWSGDGVPDVVAGSASGELLRYEGVRDADGRWSLRAGTPVMLESGAPVSVGQFAAPALIDLSGDGALDLVVGGEQGRLRVFLNTGDFTFVEASGWIDAAAGPADVPAFGDVNGDGVADLVVGTADGYLHLYAGAMDGAALRFSREAIVLQDDKGPIYVETFAAPHIADYDGNGLVDILVGNGEGFVRRFEAADAQLTGGRLVSKGFLEGQALNPFGDYRLWGGRNAVPALADVDGDGLDDLLAGQLIFGFPIAIDSPAFPYREQLQRSIDNMQSRHIPIVPHVFVHGFESAEREREELALHQEAFAAYGLPWGLTGVNQHTWRVNDLDPAQTIREEMRTGIWWNSGYRPSGNPFEPSLAGEYLWTMPFLLAQGEQVEPFILFNPAPNKAFFDRTFASYAALDLPLTYFYHMEYPILKPEDEGGYADKVQFLDQFRTENDYNFMTENQMFRSFMATFQARADIGKNRLAGWRNALENRIRTKQQLDFTVTTRGLQPLDWASPPDPELQALIGDYAESVGYKVQLGEKYRGYVPTTDAPVAMYRGSTLYFGGTSRAHISIGPAIPDKPRLERVNMPANIKRSGAQWTIELLESGMQQLKFWAPGGLAVLSDGWKAEQADDGHTWTLTRFGDAATLVVKTEQASPYKG